jgi:hypothetical protein
LLVALSVLSIIVVVVADFLLFTLSLPVVVFVVAEPFFCWSPCHY